MESKKPSRCLITLGKFDKYIFVLFLGGFTEAAKEWTIKKTYFDGHSLVKSLMNALGMSMAFVFLVYKQCKPLFKKSKETDEDRDKKPEKEEKILNNEVNVVKLKEKRSNFRKLINKYLVLFLNSLIDVGATIILNKFTDDVPVHCMFFSICSIYISCYFLFKEKIYRHHLFTMIMITLISLGHDLIKKNFDELDNYYIVYKILFNIFYGLTLTLMKFIMLNYYSPPYDACFWQGFFSLIIYIVPIFICYYNTDFLSDTIFVDLKNGVLELYHIPIFFGFVMYYFIYNMCVFIAMNHLPVISYLIMNYFHEIVDFIKRIFFDIIPGEEAYDSFLFYEFFEYISIVFFVLAFDEVFEFNFFNLNKYTKKNIDLRAMIEIDFPEDMTVNDSYAEGPSNATELKPADNKIINDGD